MTHRRRRCDQAMAFNECPLAEFMMMSENADTIEPNFGNVFKVKCTLHT